MTLAQPLLIPGAVVGLEPIPLADANTLLERWSHYLGPCRRPFGSDAWALQVDSRPVSVAVSASIVSAHVSEDYQDAEGHWCRRKLFDRGEVVELARLCSAERWATRPMLRLWREVAAPRWPYRALLAGRRGRGVELSAEYFADAVRYLAAAERQVGSPTLFDLIDVEAQMADVATGDAL